MYMIPYKYLNILFFKNIISLYIFLKLFLDIYIWFLNIIKVINSILFELLLFIHLTSKLYLYCLSNISNSQIIVNIIVAINK